MFFSAKTERIVELEKELARLSATVEWVSKRCDDFEVANQHLQRQVERERTRAEKAIDGMVMIQTQGRVPSVSGPSMEEILREMDEIFDDDPGELAKMHARMETEGAAVPLLEAIGELH